MSSAPSDQPSDQDLLTGARNCIELSGAAAGEEVVVAVPPDADPAVVDALVTEARRSGATVSVLVRDPIDPRSDVSRVHGAVLRAADLTLELGPPTGHTRTGFLAVFDHGSRQISLLPDRRVLASDAARLPVPLFFEIARRAQAALRSGGPVLVEDDRGTSLRVEVRPGDVGAFIGPEPFVPGPAVPGYVGTFPPGSTVWGDLSRTANGTLVLDAAHRFPELDAPVRLTIRDGWVTEVEGGREVDEIRDLVFGRRNGNRLAEMGIGLNPLASRGALSGVADGVAGLILLTRAAGTLFVAIGGDVLQGGVDAADGSPIFGLAARTRVRVGETLLVDDGRLVLLDHPDADLVERAVALGAAHALGRAS